MRTLQFIFSVMALVLSTGVLRPLTKKTSWPPILKRWPACAPRTRR